MIEEERIYCHINGKTGSEEWFFNTRDGECGPYDTKQLAERAFEEFIEFTRELNRELCA